MDKRIKRTQDERDQAHSHLVYEVQMLGATANALHFSQFPAGDIHNAILESFVIHARALVHFLFPLKPYESDVIADDFLDDVEKWNRKRGELPDALQSVRHRANKEVAHITWDRISIPDEARDWDCRAISNALLISFESFVECAQEQGGMY